MYIADFNDKQFILLLSLSVCIIALFLTSFCKKMDIQNNFVCTHAYT